jgi:hypothetical protein
MKMDRKPDPLRLGESRIYSRDRSVHVLLLSDRSANRNLGAGGFEQTRSEDVFWARRREPSAAGAATILFVNIEVVRIA